jgi:hypothetical protein
MLVMVLFLSILALTYEVPKLNTPKYITLQKFTAKIEHLFMLINYVCCQGIPMHTNRHLISNEALLGFLHL